MCLTLGLGNVVRDAIVGNFDVRTSKSGSSPIFFVPCRLQNALRALKACNFEFLTSKSVALYILTWTCAKLQNVIRATTVCSCSACMWFSKKGPKPSCFEHFNLKMCFASRKNSCNFSFFIWPHGSAPVALASLLLDPPDPQNIGKTWCSATFFLISHTCMFFVVTLCLYCLLFRVLSFSFL